MMHKASKLPSRLCASTASPLLGCAHPNPLYSVLLLILLSPKLVSSRILGIPDACPSPSHEWASASSRHACLSSSLSDADGTRPGGIVPPNNLLHYRISPRRALDFRLYRSPVALTPTEGLFPTSVVVARVPYPHLLSTLWLSHCA